jgi:hypothetical protein
VGDLPRGNLVGREMTTIRNNIDGLIYGLLTAGAFRWLWPR